MHAIQKRNYLNDVPSFSLGLTQEKQNQGCNEVSEIARDYRECEEGQVGEDIQTNDGGHEDERAHSAEEGKGGEHANEEGEGG